MMGVLPKTEYTIIVGDMNVVVEQESDGMVVGDHGLKTTNEKSKFLIEFCRKKLCIMNNFSSNQNGKYKRKRTLETATGTSLIKFLYKSVTKRVKNAYAFSEADGNSDHNMVIMKTRLRSKTPPYKTMIL